MHRQIAGKLAGPVTKWVMVGIWIVAVAALGMGAGKLSGATTNTAQSYLPGSAESTHVLNSQGAFSSPNSLPAVVVYQRDSGITPADMAKATADAKTFAKVQGIDGRVVGPVLSTDHKALETYVPLDLGTNGWQKASKIVSAMRDQIDNGANGLAAHVTGPAGYAADSSNAFSGIDGKLLILAGIAVIIILLLTYRSPVLWLFPFLSVVVGLVVAMGIVYLMVKAGMTVNSESTGILPVLVFGAGTDYALLLVARYREELRRHHDKHDAMAVALHRAGPAILASSSTVIISLLCLLAAESNGTRGFGPVCAVGVAVALLAMLTLLPALLVIFPRGVFWPARPVEGSPEPTASGVWSKVGRRIAVRPRAVWAVTAAALAILCLGLGSLNAHGLTNKDSYTTTQDSVTGQSVLDAHFPSGTGTPTIILARASAASAVEHAAAGTLGVDAPAGPPEIKSGTVFLQYTLSNAFDSQAAYDTIDRLRANVHAIPDANAEVGGATAINLDVQRAASHDNKVVIPLVLIVVLLILGILLRAIAAPAVLLVTVLLSFGASLGLSALIFRHVFGFAGADTGFPLLVFVFLVALGIDYNIFLMTRVREESAKHGTRRGALVGLAATGGVITSAGIVLAATFGALATIPVVAFAEIGFAVALGVLLDTIIVRAVLVTALNLDIGRHMWWPSALSKVEDVDDPDDLPEREAVLAAR